MSTPANAAPANQPVGNAAQPGKGRTSGGNFAWAATLFGTAVGAGILFLPLQAGAFGFWPLLISTLLIGPLTYLSHLAYVRVITHAPSRSSDLLAALSSYFGRGTGAFLAVAYLVMLFPVLLVYAVSITNTVGSFIVNQLGGPELPRWALAALCIGLPTLALALGEKAMLAAAQVTVVPLLIALAAFSLYLIPQWDFSAFMEVKPESGFVGSLVLILPVLVFSFTFIGSASQFAASMQANYGRGSAEAEGKQRSIIMLTTALLTIFTMLFVWSCALALGADGMRAAAEANLPILSYFANITDTPLLAIASPIIAICAIFSSYIGVALGAREGLQHMFALAAGRAEDSTGGATPALKHAVAYLVIFLIAWPVAIWEPAIIDMISVAGGLLITLFQFILPMVTIYAVARLAPLRQWTNAIVIAFGLIVLGTTVVGFF